MVNRLGCFHFVENDESLADPFGCLTKELDRKKSYSEINGSLIVLPEAFNLGVRYYPQGPSIAHSPGCAKIPLERALNDLRKIAQDLEVLFVVGLIDDELSTAFWIDHKGPPKPMCHKMCNDFSGTYRPCEVDACEGDNPIECDNACVGALICLDALDCKETRQTLGANERREKLVRTVRECKQPYKIICIPGHMSSDYLPQISGLYCILANSGSQTSFVKKDGKIVVEPVDRNQSELCLA